jgi:hypothetical protein
MAVEMVVEMADAMAGEMVESMAFVRAALTAGKLGCAMAVLKVARKADCLVVLLVAH